MAEQHAQRKLTTILAADVEGYSRLMSADEEATLKTLKTYRQIMERLIAKHDGRLVGTAGDAVLAEFGSAVEAVRCALSIQEDLAARNAELAEDRRMRFRIGINVGDVMVEGDDLFGDAVDVAARLEGLAEPGGICISGSTFDQVRSKLSIGFEDIGPQAVKNMPEPVQAFQVMLRPGKAAVPASPVPARLSRSSLYIAGAAVILAAGLGGFWIVSRTLPPPPASAQAEAESPSPIRTDKPSIAVLPFTNMSGDREQEYFSDGMTEDLITDLSKVSGLLVIARNSVFAYKGQAVKVQHVATDLGVQYVLEGSVRKSGGRVRINAQLIDARTGNHLWAERYDRDLQDVFALQDDVRSKIIAALKVKLTPAEHRRLARSITTSPEAYDLYLRGLQQLSFYSNDSNREAQRLFERAIQRDPGFARAHALLAQAYSLAAENGWVASPNDMSEKALLVAKNAVELDDELPLAYWSLGRIYSRSPFLETERALAALNKAVALDPNYADGYAFLGALLIYSGRAGEALGVLEKAMRINPHFPFWYIYSVGQAQFLLTRYEAAVQNFRMTLERNPTVSWPHRWLVSAYGHLGMRDEAEWEISELEALGQRPTIKREKETSPIRDPAYLSNFLEGFRKAGVPEE